MCLLTKQYIYRQRCLQQEIIFNAWRNHVNQVENIEKYIATKNGKLGIHQKKWRGSIESPNNTQGAIQQYIHQYNQNI